jgi:hypothetical protein
VQIVSVNWLFYVETISLPFTRAGIDADKLDDWLLIKSYLEIVK